MFKLPKSELFLNDKIQTQYFIANAILKRKANVKFTIFISNQTYSFLHKTYPFIGFTRFNDCPDFLSDLHIMHENQNDINRQIVTNFQIKFSNPKYCNLNYQNKAHRIESLISLSIRFNRQNNVILTDEERIFYENFLQNQ